MGTFSAKVGNLLCDSEVKVTGYPIFFLGYKTKKFCINVYNILHKILSGYNQSL